jgi:hypothetical protein
LETQWLLVSWAPRPGAKATLFCAGHCLERGAFLPTKSNLSWNVNLDLNEEVAPGSHPKLGQTHCKEGLAYFGVGRPYCEAGPVQRCSQLLRNLLSHCSLFHLVKEKVSQGCLGKKWPSPCSCKQGGSWGSPPGVANTVGSQRGSP